MPLTTLNTAVFAPMPSANVANATSVKPGDLRSVRTAYRVVLPNAFDVAVAIFVADGFAPWFASTECNEGGSTRAALGDAPPRTFRSACMSR